MFSSVLIQIVKLVYKCAAMDSLILKIEREIKQKFAITVLSVYIIKKTISTKMYSVCTQ